MEECYYYPANLKRKNLEQVNDDFSDFSLASPATKMRRLDVELPPIIEEEEMLNPVTFAQQPEPSQTIVDDLSHILPVNEERAIVLYDPVNNVPLLQSRSPFSFTVNSDFLSGFKNRMFWLNRSQALESLNEINEKQENNNDNDDHNNGSLAVVPWVPMHSNHQLMAEVENNADEVSEMMDADDMDVEDDVNPQQVHNNGFGSVSGCEGVNQWQQHCMVPQAAHSLSAPVGWSGNGV